MADERGYELSGTLSPYDGDAYLIISKSGYSRTKKYKLSSLRTQFKVGDQQYDEENYVADDETLTVSINALDIALNALSDTVAAFTGLITVKVSLSSGQVDTLGSAFTLMATPATANTAYDIVGIVWGINPTTTLNVGTQDLEVYFTGISNYMGLVRNANVESATRKIFSVGIQGEHEIGIRKALLCKLSGDANPTSGSVTMDFYITYKIITIPASAI